MLSIRSDDATYDRSAAAFANANGKAYAKRFTGKYEHRVLNGIGHNAPQEVPQAFAQAILDVDKF
jgi:pimeloyl-ACP methyl ester carboxylesterase